MKRGNLIIYDNNGVIIHQSGEASGDDVQPHYIPVGIPSIELEYGALSTKYPVKVNVSKTPHEVEFVSYPKSSDEKITSLEAQIAVMTNLMDAMITKSINDNLLNDADTVINVEESINKIPPIDSALEAELDALLNNITNNGDVDINMDIPINNIPDLIPVEPEVPVEPVVEPEIPVEPVVEPTVEPQPEVPVEPEVVVEPVVEPVIEPQPEVVTPEVPEPEPPTELYSEVVVEPIIEPVMEEIQP